MERSLSIPWAISVLKTRRVTKRAVNMLVVMPMPSVIANPFTSSLPTKPRITQVINVVMFASMIVENALS